MKPEWGDSRGMPGLPGPDGDAPSDSLLRRFERAAAATPGAAAVRGPAGPVTYRELADRAEKVAEHVERVAGTRPGPVALLLEPGPAQAAAALAALRTGRPYLPVDPAYPAPRVEAVLADAAPAAVADDPGTPGGPRVRPGPRTAREAPAVTAEDAYVIHTSGSTGTPKGTVIGHRGVLTMLDAFEARRPLRPGDRCSACASPGFDAAVLETWAALATGGELVPTPERSRWDAASFAAWLARERIAHAYIPAPFLPALAEAAADGLDLTALRRVVVAVEPIPAGLLGTIKRALPDLTLINGYGPTEAAVCVTMYEVTARDTGTRRAPIGTAIPGIALRIAPPGAPDETLTGPAEGELHIGGAGVGRPLRGERAAFYRAPAPGGGTTTWFRSGDLVRRDAHGCLTFLGRTDAMMKVRGYRVEPGDVEHALLADPDIAQAVALQRPAAPGQPAELVAHAVPRPGARPDPARVRRRLTGQLPWYAVPHRVEFHTAFPLTAHGKIDRAALAAAPPPAAGPAAPAPAGAPAGDPLAALWHDVLGGAGPGTPFLAAGGDSLAAGRIAAAVHSRLGRDVRMIDVLLAEGLDALRATVAAAPAAAPDTPPPATGGPPPATAGQRALWRHLRRHPDSPLHNEPLVLRLRGTPDTAALADGLTALAARHEALRTVLTDDAGTPRLTVRPPAPVPLPVRELPAGPDGAADEDAVDRAVREAAREPFDLGTAPPVRALLLRAAAGDHVLVLTVHHTAFDGTSADVLFEELAELCAARAAGRTPRLGPPPAPFTAHAAREHALAASGALEADIAHWRGRLAGLPAATRLPADRPRPADPGDEGALTVVRLPAALTGRLDALARSSGVTRFTVLLAALHVLLARYCGTREVSTGTPFSLRGLPGTERSVGYYLNTLPLRAALDGDPDVRTLLARTRDTLADAHAHRRVPYPLLLEHLEVPPGSATPYLDVCLVPEDVYRHRFDLAGTRAEFAYHGTGTAKFDLTLGIVPDDGDGSRLTAEYRTGLFRPATVDRLLTHYRTLLTAACDRPGDRISALSMLPPAERALLTGTFATEPAAGEPPRPDETVHGLVERAAARTPDAPALAEGDRVLTYRQLLAESGRMAYWLAEQGAEPGTRVGVRMPRGAAGVTAFLAVLRTGAAYVPLDPAQPPQRLADIAREAGLLLEITPELLAADAEFIDAQPEEAPAAAVRPDDPAYVIHTSGSTGRPKGVEVPHRAVTDLAAGAPAWTGLTAASRMLTCASPAFDMVTFDIWATLAAGALLAVAPAGPLTPAALAAALTRHAATHAGLPTALFHRQAEQDPGSLAGLQTAVIGGEVLAPALAARVLRAAPGLRLVNGYGPTETTAYATSHPLTAPGDPAAPVPLGRPTPRTVVRILDLHHQPAPAGVPGEIHLGGPGLALGYADRPQLTAERFVPDPYGPPGALLYATGDLARWRPDGTIEYAGRTDTQVKLHGHRVEPGEIEAVLRGHPAVTQAVVVRREDEPGHPYLAAYHTTADGRPVPSADLTALAARRLPPPLVPRVHTHLARLPVTPGGKTDRAALPAPGLPAATAADPDDPAATVAAVWCEVLVLDGIGPDERLFDIGGASLHATRIHERVTALLHPPGLRVIDLFDHPTPRTYTAHVRRLLGLPPDGTP